MGSIVLSDVAGSTAAMDLTQRSSAHYFQRPDGVVEIDSLFNARYRPNGNSLQGYGFYTRVAKNNGFWLWEAAQNWRSPGFEVNDLSFLGRADYKWMNANIGSQWVTPGSWYREIAWLVGGQQQFNYDGDRTDSQMQAYYENMFLNYWKVRSFAIYHPTVLDDLLTRGGPVVMRTGYKFGMLEVSTDARKSAVGDFTVQVGQGVNSNTRTLILQPGLGLKPSPNVFVTLSPSFTADEDAAHSVTTPAAPSATSVYGNRSV